MVKHITKALEILTAIVNLVKEAKPVIEKVEEIKNQPKGNRRKSTESALKDKNFVTSVMTVISCVIAVVSFFF